MIKRTPTPLSNDQVVELQNDVQALLAEVDGNPHPDSVAILARLAELTSKYIPLEEQPDFWAEVRAELERSNAEANQPRA